MKFKSIEDLVKIPKELAKAYTEGVYADTPVNRKLGRVGMSYAAYAEKVKGEKKENSSANEDNKSFDSLKDIIPLGEEHMVSPGAILGAIPLHKILKKEFLSSYGDFYVNYGKNAESNTIFSFYINDGNLLNSPYKGGASYKTEKDLIDTLNEISDVSKSKNLNKEQLKRIIKKRDKSKK